jgi:hypothetical protein
VRWMLHRACACKAQVHLSQPGTDASEIGALTLTSYATLGVTRFLAKECAQSRVLGFQFSETRVACVLARFAFLPGKLPELPCGKRFSKPDKVHMIRYANDFIITGISQEMLENEVKPLVEAFLSVRGLKLSHEKTTITHIDEGFDFLGWNARKYGGKLLIKPSRKSVRAFLRELRKLVKEGKALKQSRLIEKLNPLIRG